MCIRDRDSPLRLVVELEMDPVDGEVPFVLLGCTDEDATQLGPRRLRRHCLGLEDLRVRADTGSVAMTLQEIEQATLPIDVVVGPVSYTHLTLPTKRIV